MIQVLKKKEIIGDPTEVALIELGRSFKIFKDELNKKVS